MKSIWFPRVKSRGDELPTCMGRSMFQSTEEFIDEFITNYKARKEGKIVDCDAQPGDSAMVALLCKK